jgi:hypothetical protein
MNDIESRIRDTFHGREATRPRSTSRTHARSQVGRGAARC